MMHVAVTGASSGIGEALAREYARTGAAVTLVARRRERLEQIAREIGTKAFVRAADLSDCVGCCDWIVEAESALGPIDVLINNAGVQYVEPSMGVAVERAQRLLDLDLRTPMRLIHAVVPAMIARGRGAVVNICSVAALAPMKGMSHYSAAKAGLAAFSESLAVELRGAGVHVLTVYPGLVDTPTGRAGIAAYPPSVAMRLAPQGSPAVLARCVRDAVERRQPRLVYPKAYSMSWLCPALVRWLLNGLSPLPAPGR